jgi:hypothetical protein
MRLCTLSLNLKLRLSVQDQELDIEPQQGLRKLLEVGSAIKVAEQHGASGAEDEFEAPVHPNMEMTARRFAAATVPANTHNAGANNNIFTDTAFLTDGGTRSFMPFTQPKEFAQRP